MFTSSLQNDNKPITYTTGQLTPTNLLEGQRTVDPDTVNRLGNQTNDAINNFASQRQFVDKDVPATQNLIPGGGQIAASPINSGMPVGLAGALSERAQRQYGDAIQSAKTLSDVNSPYQEFSRLSSLGQQQNKLLNIQTQNYKEQMQYVLQQRQAYNDWQKAREQAQSSFLGGLLGGVGALGGALLGGPLGAMAGASVGSSVGKSA